MTSPWMPASRSARRAFSTQTTTVSASSRHGITTVTSTSPSSFAADSLNFTPIQAREATFEKARTNTTIGRAVATSSGATILRRHMPAPDPAASRDAVETASTIGAGMSPRIPRSDVVIVAGDFVQTGGMDRANYAVAEYLSGKG